MTITDWILASVALVTAITAGIRWLYSRGAEERELSIAVRENTEVTRELSGSLATLKEFTVNQFHELALKVDGLSHRVEALEKKP